MRIHSYPLYQCPANYSLPGSPPIKNCLLAHSRWIFGHPRSVMTLKNSQRLNSSYPLAFPRRPPLLVTHLSVNCGFLVRKIIAPWFMVTKFSKPCWDPYPLKTAHSCWILGHPRSSCWDPCWVRGSRSFLLEFLLNFLCFLLKSPLSSVPFPVPAGVCLASLLEIFLSGALIQGVTVGSWNLT